MASPETAGCVALFLQAQPGASQIAFNELVQGGLESRSGFGLGRTQNMVWENDGGRTCQPHQWQLLQLSTVELGTEDSQRHPSGASERRAARSQNN